MRRELLISLLVIGVALMSMGGAAFAFLSDSEASTGNSFAAGTLDLKIKDQDEHFYGDGVTATWKMSEMKPGDEVSGWVRLRNEGSVEAQWLDIDVINTVIDPPGPESDTQENTNDLDAQMIITELTYTYYTGTVKADLSDLTDIDGDGNITLDEFESQGLNNLPATHPASKYYTFHMSIQFNPSAGNEYQGDTLVSDITFTLKQG